MASRFPWRPVALALLVVLAGCARPTGDFGRAERNVIHDEIMPAIGNARAGGSTFNLTDQEVEMRDRIWRYLVAPHAYDWFGDVAVEYQRTRIVEMSSKPRPTNKYYGWLHSTRFASSRIRFTRVEEDIIADLGTLPATFASICAVIEIDRQRSVASGAIEGLEADTEINVAKRRAENRAAIGWFTGSLRHRYESYSYALDHLLVETPHEGAISANARLNELASGVEAAERGDFCDGVGRGAHGKGKAIASRYLKPQGGADLYRK